MLPNDYQEILFIESDGNQWINTELTSEKPNAGYQIMIYTKKSKNWSQYFAGPKVPTTLHNPPKLLQWQNGGNTGRLGIEGFKPNQANIQIANTNEKILNIIYTQKSLKINGEIKEVNGFNTSWGQIPYYIFNGNEENTLQAKMRLYSLRMWSGNELQRDFIPCYVKKTGENGLYDLVQQKFYKNLGTKPFIRGPEIKTPESAIIPNFSGHFFRRKIILNNKK